MFECGFSAAIVGVSFNYQISTRNSIKSSRYTMAMTIEEQQRFRMLKLPSSARSLGCWRLAVSIGGCLLRWGPVSTPPAAQKTSVWKYFYAESAPFEWQYSLSYNPAWLTSRPTSLSACPSQLYLADTPRAMLALANPAPSLGPTFGITLLGTCVGLMCVVVEAKGTRVYLDILLIIFCSGYMV